VARNHYQTLGLRRDASEEDVKRAYRKLARELHPDVTGNDPQLTDRFKAITEAYEVLSDPERRRSYDLFGTRDAPPPSGPGRPAIDLDSMFEQLFPGRKKKPRPEPGTDVEKPLQITFLESWSGATRELDDTLKVVVPAGIDDGARLRLKGKGLPGSDGGPAGDLYVVVAVTPDPVFQRDGADVHVDVVVPLSVTLLGGVIDVPVPSTEAGSVVKMTLPPSTQGGQVFRLRNKGFPKSIGAATRGSVLVTVQIRVPTVAEEDRADVEALLARLERRG
jgi:curved DNA-binding protein